MPTPLKLKIELKDVPHKIIRKVLVPQNITLYQLHLIIQDSMGWEHAHLFEFSDAKWKSTIRVGIPNDFEDDFGTFSAPLQDIFKTHLKKVFVDENDAKPFWYWYDFGDDWWHRISFLKPSKKDVENFTGTPLCVDAVGQCPPEDIGGVWGYREFLEAVKDKNHPEREELLEWYGIPEDEEYDETEIDLEMINYMLKQLYGSKQWKAKKISSFF